VRWAYLQVIDGDLVFFAVTQIGDLTIKQWLAVNCELTLFIVISMYEIYALAHACGSILINLWSVLYIPTDYHNRLLSIVKKYSSSNLHGEVELMILF